MYLLDMQTSVKVIMHLRCVLLRMSPLICLFFLVSLTSATLLPQRDLILPNLNLSQLKDNEPVVQCYASKSPPVNWASCYNAWLQVFEGLPLGRNLHLLGRHIPNVPPTTVYVFRETFACEIREAKLEQSVPYFESY